MTLLTFKPEYSVGIESMDHEHRQLIRLINELHAEMKERHDSDSVEQYLGDIHAAISAHFALEERLMQKAGYDEYEAHKEDHEILLDQIGDMMDAFNRDQEQGAQLLEQSLSSWFSRHFSTFDARLHGKLPH